MSNTLSPLEMLAVTKAVSAKLAKEARADVAPGEYTLSFDCHVEGTVRVGEDYPQKIVAKAKPWDLLTAALELANEQLIAAGLAGIDMAKVVDAAQSIDAKAVKAAKTKADAEVAGRKAPTLTDCKGKVTTSLEVTGVTVASKEAA